MNYDKLVKALRHCNGPSFLTCLGCQYNNNMLTCPYKMLRDAAAAIEALQAEVNRLKEVIDELREAQTYIDHYGDKWMTSAKDVPTAAYKHGYADGWDEARAKMEVQDG